MQFISCLSQTEVNLAKTGRNRFSILLKDMKTGNLKLYVRGTDESMRKLIHFENGVGAYENSILFNKFNGYKSIVFGSKDVSKEQGEDLRQKYASIMKSNLDQDIKLKKLAKSLENELEFEGVVGFDNSLKEGAGETVENFKKMGLNVHILSGDNLEHCLMSAQTLGLITSSKEIGYFNLDFQNVEIGTGQIRRVLDTIKKLVVMKDTSFNRISSRETYRENTVRQLKLIIKGKTIELINNDKYLLEHFRFILEFTQTVVGYEFTPGNKQQLVDLFKSLERVSIACGDGYNDVLMLKTANIGIQVRSLHISIQFGDLIADNLFPISRLCSDYCRNWNQNMNMVLQLFIRLSLVCFVIEFLFQTTIEFTSSSIFLSQDILLMHLFITPFCLIFIFMQNSTSKEARQMMPGLYMEKDYTTRKLPIKILLYRLVGDPH